MLGQRRRRCTKIEPAVGQCLTPLQRLLIYRPRNLNKDSLIDPITVDMIDHTLFNKSYQVMPVFQSRLAIEHLWQEKCKVIA